MLVCVLVSLTLYVKALSVLLFLLHCVTRFWLCSCVSNKVFQGLVCVLASLTLCVIAWSVLLFFLH